jgi:hypothetical protein
MLLLRIDSSVLEDVADIPELLDDVLCLGHEKRSVQIGTQLFNPVPHILHPDMGTILVTRFSFGQPRTWLEYRRSACPVRFATTETDNISGAVTAMPNLTVNLIPIGAHASINIPASAHFQP